MSRLKKYLPGVLIHAFRLIRSGNLAALAVLQRFRAERLVPACRVLSCKWQFCKSRMANGGKGKRILAFPQKPEPDSVLYKICHRLGVRIIDVPESGFDLAIHWEDCTIRQRQAMLEELSLTQSVMNVRCWDISKRRVEAVHQAVLGYGLAVNPLDFTGRCVKKSNDNAMHDGRIIQCPVERIEEQYVYQRLVNNSRDGTHVEDIRVPVFGNLIPFCYRKVRPIGWRFSNENSSAELCKVSEVLFEGEVSLILRFCSEIGLDYGEVDVLRDVDDERVYIVDVNNTPFGPPNHLGRKDVGQALSKLSAAFEASFVSVNC